MRAAELRALRGAVQRMRLCDVRRLQAKRRCMHLCIFSCRAARAHMHAPCGAGDDHRMRVNGSLVRDEDSHEEPLQSDLTRRCSFCGSCWCGDCERVLKYCCACDRYAAYERDLAVACVRKL